MLRKISTASGFLLFFGASQILGSQAQRLQIEEFKKQAEDIDREIEKGEAKVQKFTRKVADIIYRLNQVDLALNNSRRRTSALKKELDKLRIKIAETTEASQALIKKIKANEQYVARRMVALYKLNWLGKIHVLASAQTFHDLFQRKTALERILAYDEKIRQSLIDNQAKLEKVLTRLVAHKNEKRMAAAEYQKQIDRMAKEKTKRADLLAQVRNQKSLQLAAIESLKQSARDLDQKIKSISTELNWASQNKDTALKPFSAYKGLLKMPVEGKIVSLFGTFKNIRFNVLNFRSGIEIKSERGEPIRAVYGGRILFADWFKGYGNMIIIDHGENYYTVYAHVEETFKATGDNVETGEVIATVGDTGSITGSKLYFEVRHHGKPLDPLKWLKTTS